MIINSLLDTDFYKFTMGQYVHKNFPDTYVKYSFTNRTASVNLGDPFKKDINKSNDFWLNEIMKELNNVKTLSFTIDELNYLDSLHFFSRDYLTFLSKLNLPPVYVKSKKGKLIIESEGSWDTLIFWETFILSIVSEIYYANKHLSVKNKSNNWNTAADNLKNKIKIINDNNLHVSDFGTRRRISAPWQNSVVSKLKKGIGDNFLGTSNVLLSKQFGTVPVGTMAHELDMVLVGVHNALPTLMRGAHNTTLATWYDMYGYALSVALTDTYGTDFFFNNFSKDDAIKWKGLRQDSGDAIIFGERAISFYNNNNINPKEKLLVFSDGLTVERMLKIHNAFDGRISVSFGWGTNLTNDVGFKPLSIVVKAVEANGKRLVKLSDNINKAIGRKEDIEYYKNVFEYINNYSEDVIY